MQVTLPKAFQQQTPPIDLQPKPQTAIVKLHNQKTSTKLVAYKYLVFNSTLKPPPVGKDANKFASNASEANSLRKLQNVNVVHSSIKTDVLIGCTAAVVAAVLIAVLAGWYFFRIRLVCLTF